MALADLRAFIVEKLQQLDSTQDLTPGSPVDTTVIQPILRRLGTDPFTVDIGVFIQERLNQEFPDMPTKEGDAITDLLIKAAVLLWNPLVRETKRVRDMQSFKDPTNLTTEEAEALGANLFAKREVGQYSRGVGRIYFAQPQNCTVSPQNFITTRGGLHFFPTEIQAIRVDEMLLNVEGSLYYFDINTIAEQAGDQYNIGPDEFVTIANIASAVRVTNKARFRSGSPDENAVSFIDRIEQELTERSMVTQRGIIAKTTKDFPEVTRLNPIGFNDPEMNRDILKGGGFGPLLSSGLAGGVIPDGENKVLSRRFSVSDPGVDFTALIGPPGVKGGTFFLTVVNAFAPASLPFIRDIKVLGVVNATTLDVEDQVLNYSSVSNVAWMLRKKSLTLSDIPGGILFPDTSQGTVSVPDDEVHIGGTADIYLRGADFDDDVLILSNVVDDTPELKGIDAETHPTDTNKLVLKDLVLSPGVGANYSSDDSTYAALVRAKEQGLTVQVLDAPNAGSYRILDVVQSAGLSPTLQIDGTLNLVVGVKHRWRLTDEITVDLSEPKETRVSGSDLRTTQGVNIVDTAGGTDFDAYGVGTNDILRVTTGGLIVGDYVIKQVLSPSYSKLELDRKMPATVSGASYSVFRANPDGGMNLPLVRVDSIDLLDTSSQPVGSKIPYARPVDVRSTAFANTARGIKSDVTDGILGIVTKPLGAGVNVSGLTLGIVWGATTVGLTFTGVDPLSPSTIVSQINAAAAVATGGAVTRLAVVLDTDRVGILPVAEGVTISSGTGRDALFAGMYDGVNPTTIDRDITARDINSASAHALGGWAALSPAIDKNFDVSQVLDGVQVGFYGGLSVANQAPFDTTKYDPLRTSKDFAPEVRRHVQVGARSLGSARVFFLDPTSFEVDHDTKFSIEASDGGMLNFFPDPTNNYQRIPALPSGTKPTDGTTGGALLPFVFESVSTDFIAKNINKGDLLVIDYIPLVGTAVLADPVPNLNTKTLSISIDGGTDKTIIFIHDDNAIPASSVTRQGVVDQINRTVGKTICELDGSNRLKFNPDASVVIRGSSAPTAANTILGFSAVNGVDQSNDSPNKGSYVIFAVAPGGNTHRIQLETALPTGVLAVPAQQFKVFRVGLQRVVSTDMAKNTTTANLYYFDVQLVSEGTGDQYNIEADLSMEIEGFRADGYYLTTEDENLTFSPVEKPRLHLSRSFLQVGVSDDPANATQLSGQNLQLNYSRSVLVDNVDNFARSDTERVICASPLARHLIPHFVRFDMTYAGGSKEDVLIPDVEKYITGLFPTDFFEVSSLQRLAQNRGARSIDNPIELIAVVHKTDRTVRLERSKNKINTGRLAAFFPDVLNIKRRLA